MTHEQPPRRAWGQDQSTGSCPIRAILRRLGRKLGEDPSTLTYFFNKPRVDYLMPKAKVQVETKQ